jgi:hypothetical protein
MRIGGDIAARSTLPAVARAAEATARDWAGALIRYFDSCLRRWKGISEFCTDRRCIISVARMSVATDVELADGTFVRAGDPVGDLHLWNDQLPRGGASIAWALIARRAFAHSLDLFARHVDGNPEFSGIEAFRGEITFAGPTSRAPKVARVAAAHGFELIERKAGLLTGPLSLLDGMVVRCLIRAFNPAAPTRRFRRHRYELWISKRRLLARCRPHACAFVRESAAAGS